MKYFIVKISILLFFINPQIAYSYSAQDDYNCLWAIKAELAPFASIPGLRGHLEHMQLDCDSFMDLCHWDVVNAETGQTTRVIVREDGQKIRCTFPTDAASTIIFDRTVLREAGETDLLKRTGGLGLRPRRGINCAETTDAVSGGLIPTYLSLLPDLYNEAITAQMVTVQQQSILGRSAWRARAQERFEPTNFRRNFQSCESFPAYRDRIRSKLQGLNAVYSRHFPNWTNDSTTESAGSSVDGNN